MVWEGNTFLGKRLCKKCTTVAGWPHLHLCSAGQWKKPGLQNPHSLLLAALTCPKVIWQGCVLLYLHQMRVIEACPAQG